MSEYLPVAMATLAEDPRLDQLRFDLVPKKFVHRESFQLDVTTNIDLCACHEIECRASSFLAIGRVSEEVFWRNYFYRVSLLKQSSELAGLSSTPGLFQCGDKGPFFDTVGCHCPNLFG